MSDPVGVTVTVDLSQIQPVLDRLETLAGLKDGLAAGALHLKSKLATYPRQVSRKQPFVSDKQRRFVMASIRDGRIKIPYARGIDPRSQKLGQSWTTRSERDGLRQVVGTAVTYAPLVQSAAQQTAYHKAGGWSTDADVVRTEEGTVQSLVEQYVKGSL